MFDNFIDTSKILHAFANAIVSFGEGALLCGLSNDDFIYWFQTGRLKPIEMNKPPENCTFYLKSLIEFAIEYRTHGAQKIFGTVNVTAHMLNLYFTLYNPQDKNTRPQPDEVSERLQDMQESSRASLQSNNADILKKPETEKSNSTPKKKKPKEESFTQKQAAAVAGYSYSHFRRLDLEWKETFPDYPGYDDPMAFTQWLSKKNLKKELKQTILKMNVASPVDPGKIERSSMPSAFDDDSL